MENIIAKSTISAQEDGTRAYYVVLCSRDHSASPYVVHYRSTEGDSWQGFYSQSLVEAAKQFESRCKSHGLIDAVIRAYVREPSG